MMNKRMRERQMRRFAAIERADKEIREDIKNFNLDLTPEEYHNLIMERRKFHLDLLDKEDKKNN